MPNAPVAYPELPDPSPLVLYFLESPWQLVALLSICGLVLLYQANQARNKRFMHTGIGCIAVGLIILIIASSVTTQRELIIRRTNQIISQTTPLDIDAIKPLLTSDCTFYLGPKPPAPFLTIGQIETFIKSMKISAIQAQSISRLDVSIDTPTTARTQIWIKTYVNSTSAGDLPPVATRWEFEWILVDNAWKLHSARLLERDSPF